MPRSSEGSRIRERSGQATSPARCMDDLALISASTQVQSLSHDNQDVTAAWSTLVHVGYRGALDAPKSGSPAAFAVQKTHKEHSSTMERAKARVSDTLHVFRQRGVLSHHEYAADVPASLHGAPRTAEVIWPWQSRSNWISTLVLHMQVLLAYKTCFKPCRRAKMCWSACGG